MSNPAIAGVGTGAQVAGTAVSVAGDIFSGNAQQNMYNYQMGVAEANAQIHQQDAIYATQTGEVSAQQAGMRGRAETGAIKTGMAAGNISLSGGSAKNVIGSQTEVTQANEGIIRSDAAKRAYGFEVQAAEDTAQAGMYSAAAKTARTSEYFNVASTILGGAGNVASKWLQASQSFPSGGSGGNQDSDPTYSNYGMNTT